MTTEEKDQYKKDIESAANAYGFKFSRIGCVCSGSQLIYDTYHAGKHFELDVWHARGYWHLYEGTTKVSFGTDKIYLQQQIQKLWDLFS